MMNVASRKSSVCWATIDRLQPKADAYDNLAIVLHLLPRQSVGHGRKCCLGIGQADSELDVKAAAYR